MLHSLPCLPHIIQDQQPSRAGIQQLAHLLRKYELLRWRLPAVIDASGCASSGEYPPNTRIPTESELVETYEVARSTARRAVAALREEGLVYTSGFINVIRQRHGTS